MDIRRFPWIRRLAGDYAWNYERLAEFYAGDPASTAAWEQAITRTQQHARPREAVAGLVETQLRSRGAPAAALSSAALLRDPRTVAVVTGQQAGLFGGPLFTLLKALTALRLAAEVRERHGVPAVAIFWIDAEDHDWDEVRGCGTLDADLALKRVALELQPPDGTVIARVRLDGSVEPALAELAAILPDTEFTADLMASLRQAYRPGEGMADAFGRLLDSLLGPRGLVVYSSADPAAKPLLTDLFAREVEHAGRTSHLAIRASERLQALGYHAQATPPATSLGLFHMNAGREPIRRSDDGRFMVGDESVDAAELLRRVRSAPHEFSPNVLLRPLAQDTLFPTVCYVGGPSELAYLGQLKEVYAAFGIPMPLVRPRGTATILDGNAMRFLTRHQLPLEQLQPQDEGALNALLEAQLPAAVDRALAQANRAVEAELESVARALRGLDPTLEGAAHSTLSRMQDDLRRLQAKVIQAVKRKDETLRRQFFHARAQAFPGGAPQERTVGFVYFLNRYGPALVDRMSETLPGEPGMHYVVTG